MSEGRPFPIATDLAALCVFDAEVLPHRRRVKGDWWRQTPPSEVEEVADGRIALFPIGTEGRYRLLFRKGGLSELERRLATGHVRGLGVEVRSGELFVGVAERLPGDGRGDRLSAIPGTGELYAIDPGRYAVEVHVLDWRREDEYFDEDGEPRPEAPADFVVLLGPLAELAVPERIPDLLDLLPEVEAKGQTRVPAGVRRRAPTTPEPRERRPRGERRETEERLEPLPPPAPLGETVKEEVAPFVLSRVRTAFEEVLDQVLRHPPGQLRAQALRMRPRDATLLAQDLELDELLKKVTRVREQMRVLEQKLNAEEKLDELEQLALQLPITRVYQALDGLLDFVARRAP